MNRALKSYWAFTKTGYRIFIFLILPVLSVVCTTVAGAIDAELAPVGMLIYYVIFMIAEPIADYWLLGGFYSKSKGALEFMQSSNSFSRIMRDVVTIDIVRRVVYALGIHVLMCFVVASYNIEGNLLVLFFFIPLLHILMSEIEVFIGRHFVIWNYHYAIVLFGFTVAAMVMTGVLLWMPSYIQCMFLCIILAGLAIAVAVMTVIYTQKKVRDSYYD